MVETHLGDSLHAELAEELIQFYFKIEELNIDYYKKHLPLPIAFEIIEKYIKVDSEFQVNISAKARENIINKVNAAKRKGKRTIQVEVFDDAVHEVIQMLEQGPLVRFKKEIKLNNFGVFVDQVWYQMGLKPREQMPLVVFKDFATGEDVHMFDFLEQMKTQLEDELEKLDAGEVSQQQESDESLGKNHKDVLSNKFFDL